MANETQAYKKTLSGSVGAGMGSLFGGNGKTYFVLEHKVSSKYHKAGEAQEIIVDQVELGRDAKCAVQFDESFKTVSRRHAAIVRDGDNWKLIQLSQTNTTFLNGRPIKSEWYLQNGDEIQLSVNGPKLGFIIPTGNKSTVGSIGLSHRLSLFRQQALKPYKTAMWGMAACIVLLLCAGVGYGVYDHKLDVEYRTLTEQQRLYAERFHQEEMATAKAEREAIEKELKEELKDYEKKLRNLVNQLDKVKKSENSNAEISNPIVTPSSTSNKSIMACEPHIYYVDIRKIVLTWEGQSWSFENIGRGSGFMLNDGRFVTARHCVEPWMFPSGPDDEWALTCNAIAHSGGTVTCYIEAYSPNGKKYEFSSKQAIINRSSDESLTDDGLTYKIPQDASLDWAYFRTNNNDGLQYHNQLSQTLPLQAKLTILGYPMGLGVNSPNDIHPIYSEAVVARAGLENNRILTTATSFEHGNSGGPVFATSTSGDLIVVGLVSAGAGRSTGFVVPIANVK